MSGQKDDLDAIRTIVEALDGFPAEDQKRIIRWTLEKLGISGMNFPVASSIGVSTTATGHIESASNPITSPSGGLSIDIRTFIQAKSPQSDNHFAACVAHYYKFESPQAERKEGISSDDLLEACRKAGRTRMSKPAQTLVNAHKLGLLDKIDRGTYCVSTVGENLVAMVLPQNGQTKPKRKSASSKKKNNK